MSVMSRLAERLRTACPVLRAVQEAGVDYSPLSQSYIQRVSVEEDASSGLSFRAAVAGKVIDAWVQCTSANGSGTLQLRRGTTAITDAVACATANAISRATSVDASEMEVEEQELLNVIANGAGDRGTLFLLILIG